jgi:ADP-ribosyl-[dinitrogen reductase] hydrolase
LIALRDAVEWVVIEKFFNEVDVSEEHPPAAVAMKTKGFEGLGLGVVRLQKLNVFGPLVPDNLATREATHWDDHLTISNFFFLEISAAPSPVVAACLVAAGVALGAVAGYFHFSNETRSGKSRSRARDGAAPLVISPEGLLFGVAVGDAVGIAFECKTRAEIASVMAASNVAPEDPGFQAVPDSHPFMPHDGSFTPGSFTDDTQLTIAMIDALGAVDVASSGLDGVMARVSEAHVRAWKETTVGWGGTRDAVARLNDGVSWRASGNPNSTGNGVLMKLLPLAAAHASRHPRCRPRELELLKAVTFLTHANPTAYVTSVVFHDMAVRLFLEPWLLDTAASREAFLASLAAHAAAVELETGVKSNRLSQDLSALAGSHAQLGEDQVLETLCHGCTFFCVDSLCTVAAVLCSGPPTFASVLRAVRLGGDTDSNASMVGGVLGAIKGPELVPERYRRGLARPDHIQAKASKLEQMLM